MSNQFYNPSGTPGTGAPGLSAPMRAEFAAIAAGFAAMPAFSAGNAGQVITVNSSGTALVPSSAIVISNAGLATIVGTATFTGQIFQTTAGTPLALASTAFESTGSVNNYLSFDIRNASNGAAASSDVVVTADTGTDTTQYINLGINSSGYTGWTINGALDGYLYTSDGNLSIGTASAKYVSFFTGGTAAANERVRITSTGNVLIGTTNDVAGYVLQISSSSISPIVAVLTNPTTAVSSAAEWAAINGTVSAFMGAFAGTRVGVGSSSAHELDLYTNGLARVVISSGGAVTINTPTSGTALTLTGGLVADSLNGGQFAGFRNRIMNGDMRIDQRHSGTAITPASATFTVDRWQGFVSTAAITFQQVTDAPPGFKYSLKATLAATKVTAAADTFSIRQGIEGASIIDFQLGAASAATVTLSFWVKGSVAGTYSGSLHNASGRSYVFTYPVTNSWVRQSVVIALDTTGTWATDNTIGLEVWFDLGSGSTYQNASIGTWLAGAYTRATTGANFVNGTNGDTFNITGVQMELGSVATPFEQRPIGTELSLCQRYAFAINSLSTNQFIAAAYAAGTTDARCILSFPVPMRVTPPTLSVFSASQCSAQLGGSNFAGTAIGYTAGNSSPTVAQIDVTVAAATIGQGGSIFFNTASGFLVFQAEL